MAHFRIQRRFKHHAENGGTDGRPVHFIGHFIQQDVVCFIGKLGNPDFLRITEQPAVDIGKRQQFLRLVRVAFCFFFIQHPEQVLQAGAQIFRLIGFYKIPKRIVRLQQPGVFRI